MDSQSIRSAGKKKKKKKKKKTVSTKDLGDVPFPDDPFAAADPFDIAMAQAEREPTESGSSASKTVSKKSAMPIGPPNLDMAALIKLQSESNNRPINLNVNMNID